MRRVKVRTFSKAGLLAGGGAGKVVEEEEEDDELQCEHFFECSGCFFRSRCVLGVCVLPPLLPPCLPCVATLFRLVRPSESTLNNT